MGLQTLYSAVVSTYSKELDANEITIDEAIDKVWKSYFTKPKVSKSAFLDLCHQYDPDFAPISSKTERQKRAALTKKVRDEYRKQIRSLYYDIDPQIEKQFEGKLKRDYRIFFQGLSVDQQRELAEKITGDDRKKVLAELYVERVLNKKDELLALLDMDDAELAENFFNYMDELLLVREIQQYRDFEYTDDQNRVLKELYNRMVELSSLDTRIDMIGGAYYADYPCEQFQIGAFEAEGFRAELKRLAIRSGEKEGRPERKGGDALSGPTVDLVTNYGGLRGFAFGTLKDRMKAFVKPYGVTSIKDCVWATEDGKENDLTEIMDCIDKRELIFVDIPGQGLKALRGSGGGITRNKPVEAKREEVQQHMVRVAEKGVNRVDAANPFFLAKFTGSDQYNEMAAQHKAVKEMAKGLKFPLEEKDYQAAKEAVKSLQMATAQYLGYKKQQGLQKNPRTGLLIGRSANERMRLAAAQDAMKLADTLNFLIQYQQRDPEAARSMQQQKTDRLAAKAAPSNQKGPSASSKFETYPEEEQGKTSRQELMKTVYKLYNDMPACKSSDVGSAMVELQKEVPAAVQKVIWFSRVSNVLGESSLNPVKECMAKVVLFDYILRERRGNTQPGNEGNIVAGPVEQALNNGSIDHFKLAKSPEFNALLGKFTPARADTFLKDGESRSTMFDDAVRGVLAPVKANDMSNQPAQPQAQNVMNQPKARPQPEHPKPTAHSMHGKG